MLFYIFTNLADANLFFLIAFVLFIIAALVALYYGGFFVGKTQKVPFLEPVRNDIANNNIRKYRNHLSVLEKTRGVFYRKCDIENSSVSLLLFWNFKWSFSNWKFT